MKTSHLHDVWTSPDNSRLVSKQFSFRLPVHIAAKIAALGELYPHKNRTQIVADLLSAALTDLEKNLPVDVWPIDPDRQDEFDRIAYHLGEPQEKTFELGGTRGRFRSLANKHYRELEKELGNENAGTLFDEVFGSENYIRGLAGK